MIEVIVQKKRNKCVKIGLYIIGNVLSGVGIAGLILFLTGILNFGIFYEEKAVNIKIPQEVCDECISFDDYEYLDCINKKFTEKFEYKKTFKVGLTEKEGYYYGECVDASLYYASLLKLKGIKYKFVTLTEHVFVVAELEDEYCILDQELFGCW